MSDEHLDSLAGDDRLDEIFANYLDPPEREELLSQCPGLAATIDAHQQLDQFTAPMRVAPSCYLTAGTIIGDYEVLEEIGRDGQGVVYKARLVKFPEVVVALKMLRSGNRATEKEVQRFLMEVDNQAKLVHSNIVPIRGGGEHEGRLYFTMKLIEGGNLRERMAGKTMSAREAASLIVKIAHAVHHAHQRAIFHRDLKPSNILLDAEGVPYVADFGLSKRVESEEPTNAGYMVGAAPFVAPEQIRGETIARSDVYGLGAIFYWLLTGRPPFVGETREEVLRQVLEQAPERPRTLNPQLNHWWNRYLELICLKCLEKDPKERHESAETLAVDLQRLLDDKPPLKVSVRKVDRWRLLCRRNPLGACLPPTAALLLIAVTTTMILLFIIQKHRVELFEGHVQTQSLKIEDWFSAFESELVELRGSVTEVLTGPPKPNPEPIFFSEQFKADAEAKPSDLAGSKVHGQMVSIDHPSVFRSLNVEDTTLQRLPRLRPAFNRAMLSSQGNSQAEPLTDEEIRLLLTKTGVPFKWAYFSSKDGADCTYPGMEYPDGYRPHARPWYLQAAQAPNGKVIWVEPYEDALGIGYVLSCSTPIYDYNDEFLGALACDLLESFVNREILKRTDDPYVDDFLVNREGTVLLPRGADLPQEVKDKIKNRDSDIRTDDKLVAYFPVRDWYYVVVVHSDHIKDFLASMQGQQDDGQ